MARNLDNDIYTSLFETVVLECVADCLHRIQYVVVIQVCVFRLVGWLIIFPEFEAI